MSAITGIEWTERTWNPLAAFLTRDIRIRRGVDECITVPAGTRGWFCTKCSPGCAHCYAEKINIRLGNGLEYVLRNLDEIEFRLVNMEDPLRWRKPQMVFVNSMTDLFHEAVPGEFIAQVFGVMAVAGHHTFQVLTKRANRMRHVMGALDVVKCLNALSYVVPGVRLPSVKRQLEISARMCAQGRKLDTEAWPLQNVWLGVSVENQRYANERIPELLRTPAATRFLSCEPLLGPVDLIEWFPHEYSYPSPGGEDCDHCGVFTNALHHPFAKSLIDWVICGGESGPQARPMHPDWARSLRDQCVRAGIPFFFKQWGEFVPGASVRNSRDIIMSNIGGDGCVEDMIAMRRVGKKAAGRLLDGRVHDGFPRKELVPA